MEKILARLKQSASEGIGTCVRKTMGGVVPETGAQREDRARFEKHVLDTEVQLVGVINRDILDFCERRFERFWDHAVLHPVPLTSDGHAPVGRTVGESKTLDVRQDDRTVGDFAKNCPLRQIAGGAGSVEQFIFKSRAIAKHSAHPPTFGDLPQDTGAEPDIC